MTEYWLQKKTIGGWSHVTWYSELEQAKFNYARVSSDNSGYSWRLVQVEVVEEKLLQEVTDIEAPEVELKAAKQNVWAGQKPSQPVQDAPKLSGWGSPSPGWGNSISVSPRPVEFKSDSTHTHAGKGKVCIINHTLKQRTKVDASEVDGMIAQGWVRGGPRTQFK